MAMTIRKGVFETNSSSVHTLVIGNNADDFMNHLPSKVDFTFGEFGWEFDAYDDTHSKASYLYTAIYDVYWKQDEENETLKKDFVEYIRTTLAKWNIECEFEIPKMAKYGTYLETGSIDHSDRLKGFLTRIRKDEVMLMNFLFCEASMIYTGNDNDDNDCEIMEPNNVILVYEKGN